MIDYKLLNKIPYDVIINNIIPYTYMKKCPLHLQDIRSYYSHFSLVENYYFIYFNQHILLNDLKNFFYKNDEIYSITNQYYKIFKRYFMFQYIQHINISNYLYNKFHNNNNTNSNAIKNPNSKIKFIWGLLTPRERVNFIHKYVL